MEFSFFTLFSLIVFWIALPVQGLPGVAIRGVGVEEGSIVQNELSNTTSKNSTLGSLLLEKLSTEHVNPTKVKRASTPVAREAYILITPYLNYGNLFDNAGEPLLGTHSAVQFMGTDTDGPFRVEIGEGIGDSVGVLQVVASDFGTYSSKNGPPGTRPGRLVYKLAGTISLSNDQLMNKFNGLGKVAEIWRKNPYYSRLNHGCNQWAREFIAALDLQLPHEPTNILARSDQFFKTFLAGNPKEYSSQSVVDMRLKMYAETPSDTESRVFDWMDLEYSIDSGDGKGAKPVRFLDNLDSIMSDTDPEEDVTRKQSITAYDSYSSSDGYGSDGYGNDGEIPLYCSDSSLKKRSPFPVSSDELSHEFSDESPDEYIDEYPLSSSNIFKRGTNSVQRSIFLMIDCFYGTVTYTASGVPVAAVQAQLHYSGIPNDPNNGPLRVTVTQATVRVVSFDPSYTGPHEIGAGPVGSQRTSWYVGSTSLSNAELASFADGTGHIAQVIHQQPGWSPTVDEDANAFIKRLLLSHQHDPVRSRGIQMPMQADFMLTKSALWEQIMYKNVGKDGLPAFIMEVYQQVGNNLDVATFDPDLDPGSPQRIQNSPPRTNAVPALERQGSSGAPLPERPVGVPTPDWMQEWNDWYERTFGDFTDLDGYMDYEYGCLADGSVQSKPNFKAKREEEEEGEQEPSSHEINPIDASPDNNKRWNKNLEAEYILSPEEESMKPPAPSNDIIALSLKLQNTVMNLMKNETPVLIGMGSSAIMADAPDLTSAFANLMDLDASRRAAVRGVVSS
ncbi:MAG: hypothetical protein M1824_006022 [Vezdaea acicularis]|nr:MAG: hypothetical protein M1824_006022 [Vezdaea acicularis]